MYEVTRDHYVSEFELSLAAGEVVYDGQLDPDLIAQLAASGVLAAVYGDGPADDGNDYREPEAVEVDEESAGAE